MQHAGKAPKRAGTWEVFSSAEPTAGKASPKGWLLLEPSAAEIHRSYLLLAFVAFGALAILLGVLPEAVQGSAAVRVAEVAAVFFQLFVFALLLLLVIQAPGGYRRLLWLALFFAGTLAHTLGRLHSGPFAAYLVHLALAAWSPALLGYGSRFYCRIESRRLRVEWWLLALWIGLQMLATYLFAVHDQGIGTAGLFLNAVAVLPFAVYAVAALLGGFTLRGADDEGSADHGGAVRTTALLLLGLYGLALLETWHLVPLPWPVKSPLFLSLASCLVFYYAVQTYTDALRSVAFFNRFIRPGLKRLLVEKGHSLLGDEKFFRGRKTVILKLDMANYTRTTFDMPYGMRRLFQDLWFTLIDRVVADKVFLDKSLGDGSLYCFEDDLPGGSCRAALAAALEIRDRQLELFDTAYQERLASLLERTPELAERAKVYFENYRQKHGEDFKERRTQIRIGLVSGYADEGLWGLPSQSHYDVHGAPLILAARIEAQANNGEIVFDEAFLQELEEENPGCLPRSLLEARTIELKGIGTWHLFALPAHIELEFPMERCFSSSLPHPPQ